jgi:hypothetical protein
VQALPGTGAPSLLICKTRKKHALTVQGLLAMISRGSTRSFERASYLCADLSCIVCAGLQLGLKVFGLNAEGLLKILSAQKLLPEVSVGCNLPLNV